MAPRSYLVIANQTLAEAELTEAIRQRQQSGPSSFYLLVPNTDHGDLAARLARAAPIAPAAGDATVDAQATEHAQHRLGQLLDDLRGVGADVDGDIGDPDPLTAVDQLLDGEGQSLWTARVNPKTQAKVGRSIDLAVDTGGFHFFDADTGQAIGRATTSTNGSRSTAARSV